MELPDPAKRPKLVTWALRLWVASGVLLIAIGVLAEISTAVNVGLRFGELAIGVLVVIVGAAYCLLARRAYTGHVQWRGSLAALTCVVVAMLLIVTIGFASAGFAVLLAAAVIGLFGSLLAYRPEADAWFNGKDDDVAAGKGSAK
ncbi:MAG: hypothetical protein QM658_06565 [Gordonia sp. (in: high G+C Gram-positive bacteria)]